METSMGPHEPQTAEVDEPLQRKRWFFASRVGTDGEVPDDVIARASAQRRRLERERDGGNGGPPPPGPPGGPGSVNWTPIGPSVVRGQPSTLTPVSGRITSSAVGPGGSRVYAGAANGGVWFSSDGGATWNPLDDYATSPGFTSGLEADSLAVGAIAVRFGATAATDTIFVGTGEGTFQGDRYFGVGIKSSPSGGAPGTWSLEGTNLAGRGIFRILIDPDDPLQVYAATTSGLYKRPTSGSMTTWVQVADPSFTNGSGIVSDLIVAGTGASKRYYAAFMNDRVYSSVAGTNWSALGGITNAAGRIGLAAGESDPSVVYALIENGQLYRLVGSTFQQVSGVPNALFAGKQGWYDLVVAVDPSDANTVYLVGDETLDGDWSLSFYKGTITGSPGSYTFPFNSANDMTNPNDPNTTANVPNDPTWIGRGIHADGHDLAFALNSNGIGHDSKNVWVATDGGLFQSTMSGARSSFQPRNTGLSITQMTYIAQRSDTDAVVFAGAQDNGTERYWGEQAWFEALFAEGDGGGVAIDPNDQYRVMRQYVYATLYATTDGGVSAGSWSPITFPPITANTAAQRNAAATEGNRFNTAFYSPIAVSPAGVSPTLAAFGTNRLWLTPDWGTTWVTLPTGTNPYTPAAPNLTQDVLDGSPVQAVAFASGTRIFAATAKGVWRFDQSGTSWTRTPITTTGLPTGYLITALAVEDPVAGSVYITLGGAGFDHVWYFNGSSWQSAGLSASTIDVPTHAVAVDPDHPQELYVGTDVGCWKGTKTGPSAWTWTLFSQGLPEAAITDLAVHPRTRLLRAATHGRGVWEIQLDAASGTDPDIYLRVNYADTGRLQAGSRFPWVEGAQDPTAKNFNVYHWMSPDIKVRRGSLPGLPTLGAQADYYDFAFNIGDYIDSTTHIETADVAGVDRIFVEVHNRGLTPVPGAQVRVLLLLTDASAGLPPLPANYANRINAADTSNWLAGSAWSFADPSRPYRTLPGLLDVRTPQVVEYDIDLSALALPAGHDHVCAAAFITTAADQLTATSSDLNQVTMQDKHVAHRNLHLVAAGARPAPPGGRTHYIHEPQTIFVDFYNATSSSATVDLIFQRPGFPGHISMLLPKLSYAGTQEEALKGWEVVHHSKLETTLSAHVGRWLERLGELAENLGEAIEQDAAALEGEVIPSDIHDAKVRKLANLDHSQVYVADSSPMPTITGVQIPPAGRITAAVTVQAPADAKPGERFRFDVVQKSGDHIVGGSSYIFAVVSQDEAEKS